MIKEDSLRAAVSALRHFNRYYTNRIGVLSRYRLDTAFTLTEARVLLEIGRRGEHTQGALRADLKLDPGYLNRIVKRFASDGLVLTRPSPSDRRVTILSLSQDGRKAVEEIDRSSDQDAETLLDGLSPEAVAELVGHLRAAERLLEGRTPRVPVLEAVEGGSAVATVRVLMREYAAFLGADLSFQGFEEELAALPGKYAPPAGALFLASVPRANGNAEPAGCVALRPLGGDACEMKRLFVRPEFRGYGIGKALAERIIRAGRELGYRRMRLDTLDRLDEAVALYRAFGFRLIAPYYDNPLPGALFWEKEL
jgi:DNA-binding MarR family transcriptional regulator/ribosomal protein S18 acetylase RimI-like enzyme